MPKYQWQRKLAGYQAMTETQFEVLGRLIAAEDDGAPWVDLSDVFHTTRTTLRKRDWAVESHGLDGVRWKVTSRGRKAYVAYRDTPWAPRRFDGLCPRCGERPKPADRGYCAECEKVQRRDCYRRNGHRWQQHMRTCPACGERPVHQSPSGRLRSYCAACERVRKREELRQRKQDRLARIRAGEHIGCVKCGAMVYYTSKSVYDYCHTHYREQQNRARRARIWRKAVQRGR